MIRVTEAAAIESARFMGRGERDEADAAATEAMRRTMDEIEFDGRIVIGEGERDEAPMLYIGERVGRIVGRADGRPGDRHRRRPARGHEPGRPRPGRRDHGPRGIGVGRSDPRPGHLHGEAVRRAGRRRARSTSARRRARTSGGSPRRSAARIGDITVVILERPRHDDLIAEVRAGGRADQAHRRRRPLGGDLLRGVGHRRARGHGHRWCARGRHHRRGAALSRWRDPGPVPLPQPTRSANVARGWATATRTASTRPRISPRARTSCSRRPA